MPDDPLKKFGFKKIATEFDFIEDAWITDRPLTKEETREVEEYLMKEPNPEEQAMTEPTMTDKEVGETWLKRNHCQNEFFARKIGELIRKLVEQDCPDPDNPNDVRRALARYGIDPKTWEEK